MSFIQNIHVLLNKGNQVSNYRLQVGYRDN